MWYGLTAPPHISSQLTLNAQSPTIRSSLKADFLRLGFTMSSSAPLPVNRQKQYCRHPPLVGALLLFSAPLLASDLFDLSLTQLADVQVTLPSKQAERLVDAPASITSYSAQQLERLGYYSLGDLADITSGYSSYSIFGERVLETRGQKAGSFNNNQHLLLIDDIPIHHARNYKLPTDTELPLLFAERVEFLRGPASALYGVGAFFGAINIVPKQLAQEGRQLEAKLGVGGPDGHQRFMGSLQQRSASGSSLLSIGYSRQQASEQQVSLTADTSNQLYDDLDSQFLFARYQHIEGPLRNFSLGLYYSHKDGGLGEAWYGGFSQPSNYLRWTTLVPYIKFNRQLNSSLAINSYFKYNTSEEAGGTVPLESASNISFSRYRSRVVDYEYETELHWTLNDQRSLISGFNYDMRQEQGPTDSNSVDEFANGSQVSSDLIVKSPWNHTLSGFAQYKHQLPVLQGLLITAGLRYDEGEAGTQTYYNTSPRVSLVQKLSPRLNLKLLYGEALRAPGIKEVGLNRETKAKEPSIAEALQPEVFKTWELGFIYSQADVSLGATLFVNETRNTLQAAQINTRNYFTNASGSVEAEGIELELGVQLATPLRLSGNYSWAKAETASGQVLSDVPSQKANLILDYDHRGYRPFNANLVYHWVKDYRHPSGGAPGHSRIDINLVGPIHPQLALELQVGNLFGNDAFYPKDGHEDVPLAERSLLLSLSFKL